jgi:hypothetical protein
MFLHKLNRPQKIAFIALAKQMAKADDDMIDQAEMETLTRMGSEMRISVYEDEMELLKSLEEGARHVSEMSIPELLSYFETCEERNICLLELNFVSYANKTHDDEKQTAFICGIGEQFGVADEQLERLRAWVKEMMAVREKGVLLLQSREERSS